MSVLKFSVFFFFLLQTSTLSEATVGENVSVYQLQRLVALLTSKECDDLLTALSHPEENIFEHLRRLSPENNQLGLQPRAKRDTFSALDNEAPCQTNLKDWLLRYREKIYFTRLSRALQRIGRTDIAIEMGKNINQDKSLNLKRYVEDYHKYVSSLNLLPVTKGQQHDHQRVRKKKVSDLSWRDLDLIVERAHFPLYQKGPLDVALPLLCGLLLGFGGALLAATSLLFLAVHISRRRSQKCHSEATTSCSSKVTEFDQKAIKMM